MPLSYTYFDDVKDDAPDSGQRIFNMNETVRSN